MAITSGNTFEHIIGHKHTISLLERMLENDHIPHALLFAGPAAVGKRSVARAFTNHILMNSAKRDTDTSDSALLSQLNHGTYPDLHIVGLEEGKKDISVASVRELCEKLQLHPYAGSRKIAIVDDAHLMSIAAANAMLMTLEEPPENTIIVLVSHAPHRLPATILSRCQEIHFGLLAENEVSTLISRVLDTVSEEEDSSTESSLKGNLASMCDGTLEALMMNTFIDPLSLQPNDSKALLTHLQELRNEFLSLQESLQQLGKRRGDTGYALSLATELASAKDRQTSHWYALRRYLRGQLHSAPPQEAGFWAELLAQALVAEKQCSERNANSTIQFSSLLSEL